MRLLSYGKLRADISREAIIIDALHRTQTLYIIERDLKLLARRTKGRSKS